MRADDVLRWLRSPHRRLAGKPDCPCGLCAFDPANGLRQIRCGSPCRFPMDLTPIRKSRQTAFCGAILSVWSNPTSSERLCLAAKPALTIASGYSNTSIVFLPRKIINSLTGSKINITFDRAFSRIDIEVVFFRLGAPSKSKKCDCECDED